MQALNYLGPYKVRVEEVEKPKIEHPDDIIVKVTTVSDHSTRTFLLALGKTDRKSRLRSVAQTCSKYRGCGVNANTEKMAHGTY
jgi:hypothetical protein